MDRHVPISRLGHDVVQASYKDLHSTIDTLADVDYAARRQRLLEFTLRVRHRIARLLVAVRWFMDYSAFHQSASTARNFSVMQSLAFMDAADSLWSSAHASRAAGAIPASLNPAAEIMGGHMMFRRLPRLIETAVGLDMEHDVAGCNMVSEAHIDGIFRLGSATRNVVRMALPQGIAVDAWHTGPMKVGVRIGLPPTWTADVVLDTLQVEHAHLRILKISLNVASHADALGRMKSSWHALNTVSLQQARSLFDRDQDEQLKRMIEDRMNLAISSQQHLLMNNWKELDASDNFASSPNHQSSSSVWGRFKLMLSVLSNIMSFDVAAKFAMDHIRTQAAILPLHVAWRNCGLQVHGVDSQATSDRAVVVRYWLQSFAHASVSFVPGAARPVTENGEDMFFAKNQHCFRVLHVVHVKHDPPIFGMKKRDLDLSAIDVEDVLLSAASERAAGLISELERCCANTFVQARMHFQPGAVMGKKTLQVEFSRGIGVNISVSTKTGAWYLSPYGICLRDFSESNFLWATDRQFPSFNVLQDTVTRYCERFASYCVGGAIARSAYALDIGACFRRPTDLVFSRGQVDHAAGPSPLVSLEKIAPTNFMTLVPRESSPNEFSWLEDEDDSDKSDSIADCTDRAQEVELRSSSLKKSKRSWPATVLQKQVRALPAKRASTADLTMRCTSKRPRRCSLNDDDDSLEAHDVSRPDITSFSARSMSTLYCVWSEKRLEKIRDVMLRWLSEQGILTSIEPILDEEAPRPPVRTAVVLATDPIPVLCAELLLREDNSWEIQLTVLTDFLDDCSLARGTVVYSSEQRTVSFRYPAVTRESVTCFQRDLARVRACALLIQGISAASSSTFSIVQRNPKFLQVKVGGSVVSVVLDKEGFRVIARPARSIVNEHLASLIEEVLDETGYGAGVVFASVVEHVFPLALAIEQALPRDSSSWRLRFSMCLKARILLKGASPNVTHAVDVDCRAKGGVLVTDFARALSLAPRETASNLGANAIHKQIPKWDLIVGRVTASGAGTEMHSGSTVAVTMLILPKVLRAIVAASQRG